MPKHIKESDRGRFKIVPFENKYIIKESSFWWGLRFWKILKDYTEYGIFVRRFVSIESAKQFIDEILEIENEIEENLSVGEIYYP